MQIEYNNGVFKDIDSRSFLLGLLSIFDNQYQSKANRYFKDITWKQVFTIVCIKLFDDSPTIGELSDVMKSSHQNVKQILKKLEEKGYLSLVEDSEDRRKQRVVILEKSNLYLQNHDEEVNGVVESIFYGVSKEDILTTIETIIKMERNVEKL